MDPGPQENGGRDLAEDRGSRLRAVGGLIGVLAGLVVVLWLLSLGDDGAGPNDAGSQPEQANPLVEPPTTSSPLRAADPEDVVAGERARASFEGPFSPLRGRLVYLSGAAVALVDLATGAVTLVPIEMSGSIIPLADYELLTDRSRTVALSVEAEDPIALLIASRAQVVPSTDRFADYWVITRPDGADGAIRLHAWHDAGFLSASLEAPAGSDLLIGRDAGVLVAPPVGRTFRPTFGGFEVVSDHRPLAAHRDVRVEQRCDEQLSCAVVAVDAGTGQTTVLPEDFVSELAEFSVSPDGRWVLNDTSPAWLLDRRTEQLRLLGVGGFGQARWSEDSESVAWLTSDRTPTLVVAQTQPVEEGLGWLVVELAGLGADPSPLSTFLLEWDFSPQ